MSAVCEIRAPEMESKSRCGLGLQFTLEQDPVSIEQKAGDGFYLWGLWDEGGRGTGVS